MCQVHRCGSQVPPLSCMFKLLLPPLLSCSTSSPPCFGLSLGSSLAAAPQLSVALRPAVVGLRKQLLPLAALALEAPAEPLVRTAMWLLQQGSFGLLNVGR